MPNAHKLFFADRRDDPSFHDELKVAKATGDRLRAARDEIRQAISAAITAWRVRISKSDMFIDGVDRDIPRPRFRMQGSFAYHTEVLPYWQPPQQIDMDDGMFLPIRYVFNDGKRRPDVASQALFRLVDEVVSELCKQKGWRHIDSKTSCVRVEISKTEHVDLALYAAPDFEFASVEKNTGRLMTEPATGSLIFDELAYQKLDGSQIWLANRDEGWVPSNPKLLEEWYLAAVNEHGPQLRRVSRYLKAWRDFTSECSGLTSIALMSIAVDAFNAYPTEFDEDRDDRALLSVARILPGKLSGEIANPVVPGQRLDQSWSNESRAAYCASASNLHASLIDAIQDETSAEGCVAALVAALSDRVPDKPELVEVEPISLETKGLAIPAIARLSAADVSSRASAAQATVKPAEQTRPYYKP